MLLFALLGLVGLALVVGLGFYLWNKRANPYYDAAKSYTTPRGFINLDPIANQPRERKTMSEMSAAYSQLSNQKEQIRADAAKVPQVAPDIKWLQQNRDQTAFTWLGQSTALLQVNGKNIITDPIFSDWLGVAWLGEKRLTPIPLPIDKLPPIDLVLISHNHYDHLDGYSVRNIAARNPSAVFLVPLGLKNWFRWHGITNVVEMDWGDRWSENPDKNLGDNLDDLAIYFVPAQHWSTRYILDRNRSLWGGFVVRARGNKAKPFTFYYSGDTGYSQKLFRDIGKKYGAIDGGIDWAMIPIGAYEPRDFMKRQHENPAEALEIQSDVRAKHAFGVHWGTFLLSTEGVLQPPIDLKLAKKQRGVADDSFITLAIGETKKIK